MASPAYRSHTLNSYAGSGTSQVVTKPSGTADQDILLAYSYLEDLGAEETITWPSGFAELFSDYNNSTASRFTQLSIAWKLAGGSEPANYTISWTNSTGNKAAIEAFSGGYAADPIDDSASSIISGTGASITCPSVTGAAADTLLVCVGINWWGDPVSEATDLTMRVSTGTIAFGDAAQASSGATGTRVLTLSEASGPGAGRVAGSILIASQAAGGAATWTGWYGTNGGWF